MSQSRVLYGKKIVAHHMLNYAEQVYDIMVGEIELGRWKADERLPGVINLAKDLGFGTKTIQTAYDRLKAEGYVRTLGYRGTYLKSTHPQSKKTSGKIGILVSQEQTADPLILWYEHVLMLGARRKGLVTEVKVLPRHAEETADSRQGPWFEKDCAGIVSLTPLPLSRRYGKFVGDLPLVFLVPPHESCSPKVSADVQEAYYVLTCRVIRAGHRNISFSEDSIEPDPRQTAMHLEGFRAAMGEHGLTIDEKLLEASRRVRNSDLASVAKHIRSFFSAGGRARPTAIVAGSLGRAMALMRVAPLEKIDIPRELSVVTIGTDESIGKKITGMLPDFDHMVDTCLEMLERQRKLGRSDYTGVNIRMHFIPGETLRDFARSASNSEKDSGPDEAPAVFPVAHSRKPTSFR